MKINKIKCFMCYIPSHCAAPDFELEVEAVSKIDAIKILLKTPYLVEYDKEMLKEHVFELKKVNYNDYKN